MFLYKVVRGSQCSAFPGHCCFSLHYKLSCVMEIYGDKFQSRSFAHCDVPFFLCGTNVWFSMMARSFDPGGGIVLSCSGWLYLTFFIMFALWMAGSFDLFVLLNCFITSVFCCIHSESTATQGRLSCCP